MLAISLAVAGCAPIEGSAAILGDPAARYVIFGELHGTTESPALFGDLVCAAAEKGPVVIALEMPREDQPLLDAYLASRGDASARKTLLGSPFWSSGDGRSSEAMLVLIERLRQLKQAKRIAAVVTVVDPKAFDPRDKSAYERALAQAWQRGLEGRRGARLFALVGNIHAIAGEIRLDIGMGYGAAASFLPRGETVTLSYADAGGTAYICTGNPPSCGPQLIGVVRDGSSRGIHKSPPTAIPRQWDYLYSTGMPFTASSPAKAE